MADLVWSDPDAEKEDFAISPRGAGYTFGAGVVYKFLNQNKLVHILRAHQLCMEGFTQLFDRHLSTVSTIPGCLVFICPQRSPFRSGALQTTVTAAGTWPPFSRFPLEVAAASYPPKPALTARSRVEVPPGGSSGGFVGQQATFPSAQVNSGFLGGGYMGMGNGGYGPGGGSYITGADGGEGMFFNVFEAAPENEREGVGQPGGPGGPQGRVSGFFFCSFAPRSLHLCEPSRSFKNTLSSI